MWKKILLLCAVFAALLLGGTALAVGYPESTHPYANNTDQSWTYTHSTSLTYMKVVFSSDSALENGWDYLTITDASGNESRYTGTSLAGKTLYFKGNKITLRLTSDSSNSLYGFRITSISAATEAEYNTPRYTISNGTITGFSGKAGKLTIPSTLDGQTVTAIGSRVFADNTQLTSVTLPNTITSIGYNAFSGCTALKTATLSSKLISIGDYAFSNCDALTAISIPNTVTSMGDFAFYGCAALKTATLSSKLTSIGNNAFYGCAALTSITIPNTVTSIADSAFSNCTVLKTVALSSKLTSIGDYAFSNCDALTSISIPNTVTSMGSRVFYSCAALKTVTLSSKLTSIGDYAFYNCDALTAITIPASVTTLGNSAFGWCDKLKTLTFQRDDIILDDYALYYCNALTAVSVPIKSLGSYSLPLNRDSAITAIEFADTVAALDDNTISKMLDCMYLVVTVGKNSPILPQLKQAGICYRVRETGETNAGSLPTNTVRGKVEAIFRECIRSGMNDYEKALALHDWLVRNAEYDYTYTHHSGDYMLLNGTGVCQAYALAYETLLDYAGIENTFEHGDNHIWNMVKLGGDWYHIDVTWDDDGEDSDYEHFCVTNYHYEHLSSHECFNKPHIATAYKYNYRYRNGLADDMINQIRTGIANGLAGGSGVVSVNVQDWSSRSLPWSAWTIDDFDIRTAVLVLRDETFTFKGRKVALQIETDDSNNNVIASIIMQAPDFTLPAALKTIGAEAFSGISASVVSVPATAKSIGSKAFANCPNLWQIEIPASVTSIADNAFSGVDDLIIFGKSGSAAQTFASKNHYGFVPQ